MLKLPSEYDPWIKVNLIEETSPVLSPKIKIPWVFHRSTTGYT